MMGAGGDSSAPRVAPRSPLASAQMPNAADYAAQRPSSRRSRLLLLAQAPSASAGCLLRLRRLRIDSRRSSSGPINRPHVESFHAVYGGEVTFDADQADGDLKAQQYTLSGHVRLHETDTTIRAGKSLLTARPKRRRGDMALFNQKVFTIRSARLEGTPDLLTATEADFTTVPPDEKADYHIHAQTITLDRTKPSRRPAECDALSVRRAAADDPPRSPSTWAAAAARHGGRRCCRLSASRPATAPTSPLGAVCISPTVPVQYRLLLPTRQSVEATVTSQQTLYAPRAPSLPPIAVCRAGDAAGPYPRLRDRTGRSRCPKATRCGSMTFLPEPNPIRLFDTPSRGGLGAGRRAFCACRRAGPPARRPLCQPPAGSDPARPDSR